MTNLDSILKSRDITLPTKIHQAKAMVFLVVKYRRKSWIIKKAAAKSLQSCPTLCDPIDGSLPDFPIPGILQARTLEWGAIAFSEKKELTKSIDAEELMLLNCGVGEDPRESLRLQGDQASQS